MTIRFCMPKKGIWRMWAVVPATAPGGPSKSFRSAPIRGHRPIRAGILAVEHMLYRKSRRPFLGDFGIADRLLAVTLDGDHRLAVADAGASGRGDGNVLAPGLLQCLGKTGARTFSAPEEMPQVPM
jgi:hypothetical protein